MACEIFLGYTRVKDFRGTVADFGAHLQRELQKKTGNDSLEIFIDTKYIAPGELWSQTLEEKLRSAKMLIILLSPTWIHSEWCQREYRTFASQSLHMGISRPVVPVVWDDVDPSDCRNAEELSLLTELRAHQFVPWGELQYETWASESLRKAIARLAVQLKPLLK